MPNYFILSFLTKAWNKLISNSWTRICFFFNFKKNVHNCFNFRRIDKIMRMEKINLKIKSECKTKNYDNQMIHESWSLWETEIAWFIHYSSLNEHFDKSLSEFLRSQRKKAVLFYILCHTSWHASSCKTIFVFLKND